MDLKTIVPVVILAIILTSTVNTIAACRVNSEQLKGYARKTIERLLDVEQFGSIYWPDEPLPIGTLSKSTGLNITLVETHFDYSLTKEKASNEIVSSTNGHSKKRSSQSSLIQDIFVTCSVDRDRSYALSINLEIENPFKVIDVHYEAGQPSRKTTNNVGEQQPTQQRSTPGIFKIHLPSSSLLVQLNQRIRYDECLSVNYVQLSPTVNYEIECVDCEQSEQERLDKIFSKRMSQMDAELDGILSEKVLFGLQVLLNQQRLDLDTYLE